MLAATLADVKTSLDITDTSQDSKLTLFLQEATFAIQAYLGYPLALTSYTSEVYAVNNNQNLYLRKCAIQSVTAVSIYGVPISQGGDDGWQMRDDDALMGRLYRATGWVGRYFTRGMTYDPVGGARDIAISYSAGWYLPDDTTGHYAIGDPASLPYDITQAAIMAVTERYRLNIIGGEGLVQFKEGAMQVMIQQKVSQNGVPAVTDGMGLSETVQGKLNPWAFRRRMVA